MNRNRATNQKSNKFALFALAFAVLMGVAFSPRSASASPEGCSANMANRQFDFWLGDWKVTSPGSTSSAASKVSLDLGKCLVVEHWNDGRGHAGENLFGYSTDDKSWHGMFADNEGRVHVFFEGKVAASIAEFTGPSRGPQGETVLNRITIQRVSDQHVAQIWQKSSNGGKTWTTVYRGDYVRATR